MNYTTDGHPSHHLSVLKQSLSSIINPIKHSLITIGESTKSGAGSAWCCQVTAASNLRSHYCNLQTTTFSKHMTDSEASCHLSLGKLMPSGINFGRGKKLPMFTLSFSSAYAFRPLYQQGEFTKRPLL